MFGNFANRHVLTKIKVVKILSEINPRKIFNLNPRFGQKRARSLPCFDEKKTDNETSVTAEIP
jgi:hypothetical protein